MLLAAAVIGSGIMGERLAAGNLAIALLANTGATVAALAALIATLGPISGARFNPVVTRVAFARREVTARRCAVYLCAQVSGCCAGALLAHSMFVLPLIQASTHIRTGGAQWLSETVATAGLVFIAFRAPSISAATWRVPAWIGAAYWFTASTSFANPAITVGRSLTDTFAGIQPADVPGFIAAQLTGGVLGAVLVQFLRPAKGSA
jgi:glycerol uptake facilitator-like aquaporin